MDKGEILAQGSYEELLRSKPQCQVMAAKVSQGPRKVKKVDYEVRDEGFQISPAAVMAAFL